LIKNTSSSGVNKSPYRESLGDIYGFKGNKKYREALWALRALMTGYKGSFFFYLGQ